MTSPDVTCVMTTYDEQVAFLAVAAGCRAVRMR